MPGWSLTMPIGLSRGATISGAIQPGHATSRSLGISEPTVKKHVGRVLAKLNVQDRLQAGLFVARRPLLFTQR